MDLKFSDVDDCTSFSISSKTYTKSQKTTASMTSKIKYETKNIETREPNQDVSIQCESFGSTKAKDYDKNKLLGFLRSRMPLFENTFREQKEIENTTGKMKKFNSRLLEKWNNRVNKHSTYPNNRFRTHKRSQKFRTL